MGTVTAIRQDRAATLAEACAAFLATLDYPESRGTMKAYSSTLRALRAEFGDGHTHLACLVPPASSHPCFRSALTTCRSFIALGTTVNLAPLDVNIEDTRTRGVATCVGLRCRSHDPRPPWLPAECRCTLPWY